MSSDASDTKWQKQQPNQPAPQGRSLTQLSSNYDKTQNENGSDHNRSN